MKRLVRLTVVLACVAAALTVVLVALWNAPRAGAEETVFSDRAATDVVSVHIVNAQGTVDVSAQDGGYAVDGVPAELVDIDGFIGFLVACSDVRPLRKVDETGLADDAFGLDAPGAKVDMTYTDGGLSLTLGKQDPVSGAYYCRADGFTGVYLLAAETAEQYLIAKQALISFYVTPKLNVSSALSALADVTFTGGGLAAPVTIESVSAGDAEVKALARSFGAATHIVRGAGVYELDQTYGLTVLSPLCGLTGKAIVSYGLSSAEEDAMGFTAPYMQVEFDYRNSGETAEHYTLRLLPAAEDGSLFYANVKGSGTVFVIAREAFLDISYEKLLLRWFLSPMLMDVNGITVETHEARYTFAIDNTDKKNPVVEMDGEPLDVAQFRKFFALLGSAANDGTYLGVQPAPTDEPLMTISYQYGEGKADDVMALYAGASRRVNVYVNGVCEFAMKDSFVQRVSEALVALQSGDAFDENW